MVSSNSERCFEQKILASCNAHKWTPNSFWAGSFRAKQTPRATSELNNCLEDNRTNLEQWDYFSKGGSWIALSQLSNCERTFLFVSIDWTGLIISVHNSVARWFENCYKHNHNQEDDDVADDGDDGDDDGDDGDNDSDDGGDDNDDDDYHYHYYHHHHCHCHNCCCCCRHDAVPTTTVSNIEMFLDATSRVKRANKSDKTNKVTNNHKAKHTIRAESRQKLLENQ